MSFDGFYTHMMQQELADHLIGGKINKIYQPFLQEIQLVIRSNGQNHRLTASIHPVYYRIHLTEERSNNPKQAPMFCMLLRKHIENAVIQNITQLENDRILIFDLSSRNELGDNLHYQLIFELMGRHSNIVLINPATQTIIDCIKHVPASQNTYRTLQAGAEYRLPPQQEQQVNLFKLSDEARSEFAKINRETIESGQAHRVIQGLSKITNQQLLSWLEQGDTVEVALERLLGLFSEKQPVVFNQPDPVQFYSADLPVIEGERQYFASLGASLDYYYTEKARLDHIKQLSGDLSQHIQRILKRNDKKLTELQRDRVVAQKSDEYKLKGELLSAFASSIQRGQTQATVTNYYTNEPITIELDPQLSAIDNSQAYFRKYSKYRDSLKYIDQQEQLTQQENQYLESVLVQISQATVADIEDIKDELRQEGYMAQHKKQIKKRATSKSRPRVYVAKDETRILVGRNNHQNDQLSVRNSHKNYWWLHAKDIPGAHVVIESVDPSPETIQEAAEIAAYHSKSSHSANVPVDLVQLKALRKPNGAKPGFVIYEGQETLFVTPVEEEIKSKEQVQD